MTVLLVIINLPASTAPCWQDTCSFKAAHCLLTQPALWYLMDDNLRSKKNTDHTHSVCLLLVIIHEKMLSLQALIVKLTLSIPTLTVSVSPQPDKSQTEIGLLSFLPKGISISHSAIGRPNNRLHNELLGLHYIL